MDPPLPTVEAGAALDDAFRLLSGSDDGLDRGPRRPVPAGIVTKLDLLEFVAHRAGPG